jgi:pilus assembly protein Flp/PilA
MSRIKWHSRQRGQGLVEYALILALVAVVVIVVGAVLGNAVQRVYAVIAGTLGTKYDTVGEHSIVIETAACYTMHNWCKAPDDTDGTQPKVDCTGLVVNGTTKENVAKLTASTEQSVGTTVGGVPLAVEENGDGGFKFYPILSYTYDAGVCPRAVVVQSTSGAIAISPVTVNP